MKYISRILFVLAVLFVGRGTAQAQRDDLKIVKNATGVTIETYVSSTEPGTSYSASGTEAENVQHDQYLVLKVTPAEGKWLYKELLEVQVAGSPGGALSRAPEVKIAVNPTGLSTNQADGTGYYYYQIPSECTAANGYKNVIVTGTSVGKIDLSTATIDGTGKVITKTTDGWTATITLDEVSWTYDESTHCPAISTFTLTNGTKTFSNTASQVAISGAQTNAGNYNATLSAVTGGCFVNSKSVPFSIGKKATEITINTPPGGGDVGQMDVDDTYTSGATLSPTDAGSLTFSLSKESIVTVDADGVITAVGEGEVTITFSFPGNENYAAAESKTMKIQVSKVPTEITVSDPILNLKVHDECGTGAALTPSGAGSLTYTSDNEAVAKVVDGNIKAFAEGTATITASYAGNTKYAAADSKTITVNVSLNDASVSVDKGNVELLVGGTHDIVATTTPVGLTVTYTPDASGVVNVDANGKVTALKEGNATITVSVGGDGVYKYNAVTVNVHVTKVLNEDDIVLTIPTDGYIYDATAKEPAVTVKYGDKTLTQGTDYNVSYSNNVNAGENTATVTVIDIDGGDYNVSGEKKFSIAQKEVGLTWGTTSFNYDGNSHAPSATVTGLVNSDDVSAAVTISANSGSSLTDGKAVNVGGYTATVTRLTGTKAGNYKLPATGLTQTFNINASDAASAVVTANDLTYDGTAQDLVTIGTITYGATGTAADIVFYESATSTTPLTVVPQGTNAGTYDVFYEVTPDINHTAPARSQITVTIKKKALTITAKPQTVTLGTAITQATDQVTAEGLVAGHTLADVTLIQSTKDVTTSGTITPSDAMVKSGDTDVTANYDISYVAGTLTVKAFKVNISVVDVASGEEIEGATVQVLDKDGSFLEDWVSTKESHEIVGLKNGIEYTLKETVAPDGYTIATDITFTIDENGKVTTTGTMTDEGVLLVENAKSKVEISVVEIGSGEILEGATVQVLDGDGNVVDEWVSAKKNHSIEGLKTGLEYTLKETVAPNNYELPKETKFTIDAVGKVTSTGSISSEGVLLVENGKIPTVASAVVTANNLTYDGTAQNLVTIGTITYGATGTAADVEFYESATSTTPLTAVPQGTNAGTYEVYYEVKPDADHTAPARAKVTVTISPLTVVVTIAGHNNTTVYDGKEHSVSGYDVEISTPLYTEADFTFSGTAEAKRTEKGQTNMGLKAEQFTNTNNNFEVSFKVTDGYQKITSPDEVIVKITGHSSTDDYDGKDHSVEGYDVEISNPLYTKDDFTFSGTDAAARKNAGTTSMELNKEQFENTNSNFDIVTFVVVKDGYQTISPITATVTINGHYNTAAYNGEEHSVKGYDVKISNPLYTKDDFTFSGTDIAARTDEGTTYMGLTKDQFTNTNENFINVTFTVTDGYQTITSVNDVVVTIIGESHTDDYDGEEHSVKGYKVEISNPLYNESDFTFSGTATAVRKDAGTTYMGLNASQFKNNNSDFANVTFNVTDGYQTISPISATVEIKGHSDVDYYDGTEHKVSGYDVSFSNNLYLESYFTFSGGTASAAQTDQGTAYMGLAANQFANTSDNFINVTFTVTDGSMTILKKVVKPTVTVETKTYDGNTDAQVNVAAETGVTGESLTITGVTGTFGDANVGTDKTVTLDTKDAVVTAGNDKTKVTNYEVIYPETAKGTITSLDDGSFSVSFDSSIDDDFYIYNGQEKKPGVRVKDGDKELVNDEDYTVSYSNNVNAGENTACVTVKGIGNYDGSLASKNFSIYPKTIGIDWSDTEVDYDGKSHLPTAEADGLCGDDECTIAVGGDQQTMVGNYTATATGLSNANYALPEDASTDWYILRVIEPFAKGCEWATFVAEEDLQLSSGLQAFVVTGASSSMVNTEGIVFIPANVGILLKRSDKTADTYRCRAYDGEETAPVSKLNGSATESLAMESYKDYVLYNDQFSLSGVSTVGAGHAYLPYGIVGAAGTRSLMINGDGSVTGIDSAGCKSDETNERWHSLDGRMLQGKPTKKGLYIRDGRKVVIK